MSEHTDSDAVVANGAVEGTAPEEVVAAAPIIEEVVSAPVVEEVVAAQAPSSNVGAAPSAPTFDEAATFIGPKADYYIAQFQRLDAGSSMVSWNWSAFLFGIFWLLYRKMYLYALIAFAILCIPMVGALIFAIGCGILGNWLYKKKVEEELAMAATYPPATKQAQLAERGGITWLPVIVASVIVLILIVSMCGLGALSFFASLASEF